MTLSISGSATAIQKLSSDSDVSITSVADTQFLRYVSSTSRWTNYTGPKFRASLITTNQSIPTGVPTKVAFNTTEFDVTTALVSNSRFLPTVAGYYLISASIRWDTAFTGDGYASVYKNGSEHARLDESDSVQKFLHMVGSDLVFLNGSTDYVEIFAAQSSAGSINVTAGAAITWWNGHLVL